jgi:hypothetical protein
LQLLLKYLLVLLLVWALTLRTLTFWERFYIIKDSVKIDSV